MAGWLSVLAAVPGVMDKLGIFRGNIRKQNGMRTKGV